MTLLQTILSLVLVRAGLGFVAATAAEPQTAWARHHARDLNLLQKRETCGPGIGACGAGLCCS